MRRQRNHILWAAIAVLVGLATPPTSWANEALIPWLEYVRVNVPEHAAVVAAVLPLIQNQPVPTDPDLAVITFRAGTAGIQDAIVQLYQAPPIDHAPVLNSPGGVRDRLGGSWGDAADQLLNLVLQPPTCFGPPAEVRRQQRAFNLTLTGDLTLLREQTVEPLYVIGVLAHADRYLPSSLRARVRFVVFTAQLDFGEWRVRLNFVTDNSTDAAQVGNIVATWRDLANSLAAHYTGHTAGDRLREALQASSVVVSENRVTATGAVPAPVISRVARDATAYDNGCPPGGVCDSDKIAICHKRGNQPAITLCVPPTACRLTWRRATPAGPCAARAAASTP